MIVLCQFITVQCSIFDAPFPYARLPAIDGPFACGRRRLIEGRGDDEFRWGADGRRRCISGGQLKRQCESGEGEKEWFHDERGGRKALNERSRLKPSVREKAELHVGLP